MKRLETIDSMRGITMLSMILFHFCWDLKYIDGFTMDWYGTKATYLWQQSICWTFILIAGFCMHFARKPLKNGLVVFVCGFIVTVVTMIALPEAAVIFGVLTCIGSCMLLTGAIRLITGRLKNEPDGYLINPFWGFFTTVILFAVTKSINYGYLIFGPFMLNLPRFLYTQGGFEGMSHLELTYLGFMQDGFYSTDYFSLMPWMFLFLAGYYLYGILKNTFAHNLFHIKIPFFTWFGRHSLLVYMLHQPLLYLLSLLLLFVQSA